jgi:hypothetical protein
MLLQKAYVDLLESQISNLQAQISTLVPAPLPSVTVQQYGKTLTWT